MRNITNTLVLALLFAGVVFLQIFLSKRESRWPGFILPAISFLCALLVPLNAMAPADGVTFGFLLQLLIVFLLANIPTVVLVAIYCGCREKLRRRKLLEKMNIQDLDSSVRHTRHKEKEPPSR